MSTILVQTTPATPGLAIIKPARFLGDRFALYRDRLESVGARFNWDAKHNELAIERLPKCITVLEAAGFQIVLAPDLAQQLAREAQAIRADLSAGEQLVARIDAELAERGLTLFQHQREGIAWLAPRRRALLADAMGLGKSAQALLATPRDVPVTIVCPASVKLNWAREIALWRPDLRPRVLAGRKSWQWPLPGEAVIANYEILPKAPKNRAEEEGITRPGRDTVLISDESHFCKNARAARTKNFRACAKLALEAGGRVYLLTGTPLTNRPIELWHVLNAAGLAEDAFGSFKVFQRLMGGTEGRWGLEWSGDIDASVPARLRQVSLYRRREDVLDLPPKMRVPVHVPGEFPPDVRKLLDALLAVLDAQGIDLDRATELVDLTRVTGAAFEQLAAARAALATAKIPAMVEAIQEYEEAEEPVLVFSAHRAPIDLLSAREGWATITGDTPSTDRQAIVDAFQAGELKGLGLTIKAGGIGITLTRAAHEIFVDCAWTPADNNQAEDRAMRIGQTRPVLIKRLVANHEVDRRVEAILRAKQALIDAAIEPSAIAGGLGNRATAPLAAQARSLEQTLARAGRVAPPPAPTRPPVQRHGPQTALEYWIADSLAHLAGNDPDHASVINDVGFNKLDNDFGHSLARQLADGGLTPRQWDAARQMLAKYHRQIGFAPTEEIA